MIDLECRKCGGRLDITEEHSEGVTVTCEKCNRRFYYRTRKE